MFEADDFKPEETSADAKAMADKQETIPNTVEEINYKELYLRTNADFQNFKRRVERERTELAQLMQAHVIEKLLPTVDDLERALETAEKSAETPAVWLEGLRLIAKNLNKRLTELGVEEIGTAGVFNPELHEALMQVEDSQHQSGHIVQLFSKGYSFKGKVIKHARVSVAK